MPFFSPKSKSVATSNLIVYPSEMHLRLSNCRLFFLLLLALNPGCSSEPKPKAFTPPPAKGLVWRVLHPFASKETDQEEKHSGIVVTIQPDSTAPSLAATRQLGVRIRVTNFTNTLVSLSFPTSQRIEIIGRRADGKIFYDYKTDRNFTQDIGVLSINPGEYLEYSENIPTKNMLAGQTVLITASVVGRSDLQGTISIVPKP